MMMRFLLKNQYGFSMIQGMILASAVAMMAYVGTKLSTDQKMAQKGMESKAKVDQLHDAIFSILQNKDHCTATFLDTLNNISSDFSPTPKNFSRIVTAPDLIVPFEISAGDINKVYMSQSVSIESMQVIYPVSFSGSALATIKMNYGKLESGDDTKRTHQGFGGKRITKNISVVIQRKPSNPNQFLSCYAVSAGENDTLNKDFCERLGALDTNGQKTSIFTWDSNLNYCVLKDTSCGSGFVFTGFSSLGTPICKTLQDAMNFSDLIDPALGSCPSSSTAARFTIVNGKVGIVCQ